MWIISLLYMKMTCIDQGCEEAIFIMYSNELCLEWAGTYFRPYLQFIDWKVSEET